MRRPSGPLGSMPQTARLTRSVGWRLTSCSAVCVRRPPGNSEWSRYSLSDHFLPVSLHLLGVDDDHEVAGVGVGRERRAVLAAQDVGDLGRGAARASGPRRRR